jgi:DNA ligase (NAD+)
LKELELEQKYHSAFKGKRFVVSGIFHRYSREELKKEIESFGGIIVSSVSSKTTYLIAGSGMGPTKKEKAEQLNIPILNESEYVVLKN